MDDRIAFVLSIFAAFVFAIFITPFAWAAIVWIIELMEWWEGKLYEWTKRKSD
jgi:hypothetical protein